MGSLGLSLASYNECVPRSYKGMPGGWLRSVYSYTTACRHCNNPNNCSIFNFSSLTRICQNFKLANIAPKAQACPLDWRSPQIHKWQWTCILRVCILKLVLTTVDVSHRVETRERRGKRYAHQCNKLCGFFERNLTSNPQKQKRFWGWEVERLGWLSLVGSVGKRGEFLYRFCIN